MAHQVAVLTVVIFMALIGLAHAAIPESTIADVTPSGLAEAPDSTIGPIDEGSAPSGNDNVEAAPVGGSVPPGVFSPEAPASSPGKNGAAALEASAVAGAAVATVAGYFL